MYTGAINQCSTDSYEKETVFENTMTIDNKMLLINEYGKIKISIPGPTGVRSMKLIDVIYVPSFMTNLICLHRLDRKGLHFDSGEMHLYRKRQGGREHVMNVTLYNGHYLLEDNRSAAFFLSRCRGTDPTSRKQGSEQREIRSESRTLKTDMKAAGQMDGI